MSSDRSDEIHKMDDDMDDDFIECKHCHEWYDYEFLKEHFMTNIKYFPDYKPKCIFCHQEWDNTFIDNLIETCKKELQKETCKKELQIKIKFPEDCIICDGAWDLLDGKINTKIICPFCNKNICIHCITECLHNEALKNYRVHNNDPNIRYVIRYVNDPPYDYYRTKCFIDDTLHCPNCKHIWSNQYIYEIYKKYVYKYKSKCKELHIAVPSMLCYKCGEMPNLPNLRCRCCDKLLCKSCYKKIIDEEYGLIDTSTHKYSLVKSSKKHEYRHVLNYVLNTQLRCKECSEVLCKIKLVYSPLYHGNDQYDEYKFVLINYTISDT